MVCTALVNAGIHISPRLYTLKVSPPGLADPDMWMRKNLKENLWEYICVYVDDLALALAMKDPKTFIDKLKALPKDGGHGYQIKGDGPFHLGCDYIGDKDGTFRAEPKKYIAKMVEAYEKI